MRGNSCYFILFLYLSSRILLAGDSEEKNLDFNWLGTSHAPAVSQIKQNGINLTFSDGIEKNKINLRPTKNQNYLEVFNAKAGSWVKVRLDSETISEAQIENPHDVLIRRPSGQVVPQITEATIRELATASDCYPVKVTIYLRNSTPGASLYVDSDPLGETDKNGMLTKSPDAKCKNRYVDVDLMKTNCTSFQDFFVARENPQEYHKSISLDCKAVKRKNRRKTGRHGSPTSKGARGLWFKIVVSNATVLKPGEPLCLR